MHSGIPEIDEMERSVGGCTKYYIVEEAAAQERELRAGARGVTPSKRPLRWKERSARVHGVLLLCRFRDPVASAPSAGARSARELTLFYRLFLYLEFSYTGIKPEEAIDVIRRARELTSGLNVAGIAGPGDTLATGHALETFRLIGEAFPDIIKCMSTNGLLLKEKAREVIETGIDSLTVTVNAVDPEIEAKLNGGILYHGVHYTGVEAAEILIENQLAGIREVSTAGITVKVNTVLVPGINDDHIETIAKTVSEAGASIYNIIPLIPQNELSECRPPTCVEIDGSRQKAEPYIDVFRHCQRCRADAIGVPGETDYGDQIYLKRVSRKDTFSHG